MGIVDGQPVDAANSNPAWLDANANDIAYGEIGFQATTVGSGPFIENTQKLQNKISETIGLNTSGHFTAENDTSALIYGAPANTINDGDNHKVALTKLAQKFDPGVGHKHTGLDGDAPQISAATIANVPLHGYWRQSPLVSGVTGSSWDVTAEMTGKVPSVGITSEGVVIDPPFNRVFVKNDQGETFEDTSGNIVYGRILESAGTWTLEFYVDISGVETAYTFSSSVDLVFFYQELLNPLVNPPVYSELAFIPSDNITLDVATATTGQQGKVLLSSVAPDPIAATGSAGTGTGTVANADHTHEGVHSVGIDGDPNLFLGDVKLKAGLNITLTPNLSANAVEISGISGSIAYQEIPSGLVNGTNTVFGPLSYLPSTASSIAVFVDGLVLENSAWTLMGLNIVFGTPPSPGQKIYVYYLTTGSIPPPPVFSNVLKTEYRVVTASEATSKSLTLAHSPVAPTEVILDWEGVAQFFGDDFTVTGSTLSWSGYGLDSLVTAGDKMRVVYVY